MKFRGCKLRSFSRVVGIYCDYLGGQATNELRRVKAQQAAQDLSILFRLHPWRWFERSVDTYLWGTQNLTLTSLSGELMTFTETADQKWVGQDIVVTGSTIPHLVSRINATNSLIIDPPYEGAAITVGDIATIRQIRLKAPSTFGSLLDPVKRDSTRSFSVSPQEMDRVSAQGGGAVATGVGYIHTVQGRNITIWPPSATRLSFRYKFAPGDPFEYGDGNGALVMTAEPDVVIGSGTKWTSLPDSGAGLVFESDTNIARGTPVSNSIVVVGDDTHLVLATNWLSPLQTSFGYKISTDLGMPPYMARWVDASASMRAGKAKQSDVSLRFLEAVGADSASDETKPMRGPASWESSMAGYARIV